MPRMQWQDDEFFQIEPPEKPDEPEAEYPPDRAVTVLALALGVQTAVLALAIVLLAVVGREMVEQRSLNDRLVRDNSTLWDDNARLRQQIPGLRALGRDPETGLCVPRAILERGPAPQ